MLSNWIKYIGGLFWLVLISGSSRSHEFAVKFVRGLRVSSRSLCLGSKVPYRFPLPVNSNLSNPLPTLWLPIAPLRSPKRPPIPAVFGVSSSSQVFRSIVAAQTVPVVHLIWPLSSEKQVDKPVLSKRLPINPNVHIPIWTLVTTTPI